jgi:hypothetical protein
MATRKASSKQQSVAQNEARWGKERYMETYNLTKHNNNQQHTSGTRTQPYANKAHSGTCMPTAEPMVRAAARPGSSQNPCVRHEGPLQR